MANRSEKRCYDLIYLSFTRTIICKPAAASNWSKSNKNNFFLQFHEEKNRFGLHLTFKTLLQAEHKSNFMRISFSAGGSACVSPAALSRQSSHECAAIGILRNWRQQMVNASALSKFMTMVYNATWNGNHKTNLLIVIAESTFASPGGHWGGSWGRRLERIRSRLILRFLNVDLPQQEIKTKLTPSFHFHALSPRPSHSNDNCSLSAFIRRHSLSVRLPHQRIFSWKAHRRHSRDVLSPQLVSRWKTKRDIATLIELLACDLHHWLRKKNSEIIDRATPSVLNSRSCVFLVVLFRLLSASVAQLGVSNLAWKMIKTGLSATPSSFFAHIYGFFLGCFRKLSSCHKRQIGARKI